MRGINRKFNNNSQITPLCPVDVPVVTTSPSFSRRAARAPRRAYSQANPGLQLQLRVQFLHHSIRGAYTMVVLLFNILKTPALLIWIASKPVGPCKETKLSLRVQ